VPGAAPAARVETPPLALERLQSRRRRVEQREPGDVDSAVTEVVQLQLVHRLYTARQLGLLATLEPEIGKVRYKRSMSVRNVPRRYGNSRAMWQRTQCYLYHPAEATFPPLPQPIKAGTRFIDPGGTQG